MTLMILLLMLLVPSFAFCGHGMYPIPLPYVTGGGSSGITNVGNWEQETSGASISITVSGIQENDYVLLYIINDANVGPGITWPSGFTQIATEASTFDAARMAVAGKFAAGGETSFALSSGDAAFIAGCSVFRGVNTTTPLDVTTVTSVSTGEASPFDGSATIVPASNNNMLVLISGFDINGDANAISASVTGGGLSWSTFFGVDQAPGYMHIGSSYATQATAGSITATATGAAEGFSAAVPLILLSLRPQ